ncbi:redoxin domain-containing protein [Parafilimonas sp.]|uniref:redoxin domain-containing protein n=1 Tax=Parafilimonas sp. TaxID=1969739 RepID=UPI003F81C843
MISIGKRIKFRVNSFGIVTVIFFLLLAQSVAAQQKNDSVFNAVFISKIALNTTDGKSFYLNGENNQNFQTLLIFLSPECPLCKNYSPVLNDLYKQYSDRVNIYGIIPGKAYSAIDVKAFQKDYHIPFPLLTDSHKELTQYLQATVTPQVILLDNKYRLLYKGAIDNRLQSLGKQRLKPTAFYLNDALQASLSNKIITIKRTKAVGCIINDY